MNATEIKTWLASGKGAVSISVLFLLLALAESTIAPWSPYFPLFALFALALPLILRAYRFGQLRSVFRSHLSLILIFWFLFILWDQMSSGVILKLLLDALGVTANPVYSLPAAIDQIFVAVTARMAVSLSTAQVIFAFFAVVWAPLGEELFYRGYVYGALRERHGFWPAALISSAFFGMRHMLPFLILLPQLLVIPALNWGVLAFVFGLMCSYLYEKTGSLYPCIIGHFLTNIAALLVM